MPSLPPWDALHPLVIHFPIALLLVAPLFMAAGIAIPKNGKWFQYSGLGLLVMGSVMALVAVSTGEAAGELAERTVAIEAVLEEHEELAETTRTVFAILTVVYAALLAAPLLMKKDFGLKVMIPVHSVFIVVYFGCLTLLVNTAHCGGVLVHEYGVHAMLPKDMIPPPSLQQNDYEGHEHEEWDDD